MTILYELFYIVDYKNMKNKTFAIFLSSAVKCYLMQILIFHRLLNIFILLLHYILHYISKIMLHFIKYGRLTQNNKSADLLYSLNLLYLSILYISMENRSNLTQMNTVNVYDLHRYCI